MAKSNKSFAVEANKFDGSIQAISNGGKTWIVPYGYKRAKKRAKK